MKPLVSLNKMGLSIYSVELRTKKSYSNEYILRCVGGGYLRYFSFEDVLNIWVENWGWAPYSVGGGDSGEACSAILKRHFDPFTFKLRYSPTSLVVAVDRLVVGSNSRLPINIQWYTHICTVISIHAVRIIQPWSTIGWLKKKQREKSLSLSLSLSLSHRYLIRDTVSIIIIFNCKSTICSLRIAFNILRFCINCTSMKSSTFLLIILFLRQLSTNRIYFIVS